MNIPLLFFVAIALSMDTFSLSLSLGTFDINKKNIKLFAIIVGIFHFIMPVLGSLIGSSIKNIIPIHESKLLGIIFLFITIEMLLDLFSKKSKKYDLNLLNMIFYAFSVSIDSFSVGIGLLSMTTSVTVSSLIFCIVSACFTYTGLIIGKYSHEKLGDLSKIIGLIIILVLTILHLH